MWFLIETDDESKIGIDENRRVLLSKNVLNIEPINDVSVKITCEDGEMRHIKCVPAIHHLIKSLPVDLKNPKEDYAEFKVLCELAGINHTDFLSCLRKVMR